MKLLFTIFLLFTLSLNINAQERPKIGLVLSGGGAKGIAHIGVIRELEKRGIKPDYITGTSMGALIGGLYAAGYNPDQMEEIIVNGEWDYLMSDEIKRENYLIGQGNKNKNSLITLPIDGIKPEFKSGLFDGQNILTLIEILVRKYNRPIDFDSLEIPFKCIGTNIETGEAMIFESGKLADAMRASMSIPSVFAPYEINGELYVDGGLVNNFPTDVVKEMGADIIIGVDVGAVLYKKNEIKSIMQILDQTASFYNYRVAQQNAKLCDIYIRPNIIGLSAMDFSDAISIIDRGVLAFNDVESEVDSIFKEYNLPVINHKDTLSNHIIHLSSVTYKIDGYRKKGIKAVKNLIKGKLEIETPCTLTEEEFSRRINRLYGSSFFSKISTNFSQNDSAYALEVVVREQTDDDFNIGVRYDSYYNINLFVGANFRNKLLYGSLLEMSLVAGDAHQLKLRYTTDRGSDFGVGTSFTYDKFFVNTYVDNNAQFKYSFKSLVWDLFAHRYFNNYNRAIFGIEASNYILSETQTIVDIPGFNKNYGKVYAALIHDSWDRAYFPNKGVKLKGRTDAIVDEDGKLFFTAWASLENTLSISKKFKIDIGGFIGYGSADIENTVFQYMVGGMEQNRIQWYNSQPGLHYLEKGNANIWQLSVAPRVELFNNTFISWKLSVVNVEAVFENMFIQPKSIYAGTSLALSYNSMFGPMSITGDYSFTSNKFGALLSLGYWF